VQTAAFIAEHEGRVPYVYDDYTGAAWKPGGKNKGDPTIGIGFNLARKDAREKLEAVGADYDKIMAGKEQLTNAQQDKLFEMASSEVVAWVDNEFRDDQLTRNQKIALYSLAYNSRWRNGRPTLIGPKLTEAIKKKDWEKAHFEIAENSMGGIPDNLKRGIKIRRTKEAAMFRGNG
jgi:GH24 family phage-related lysozyme (muramidase)